MISRNHHLFLVEDDAELRQMLASYLERQEFGVTAMATAEELLRRVARLEPDLVLLDIGLPGLGGLEACRLLRARGVHVPVIMLSGRADIADRVIALETGADDYLVKPYAALEVHARLRELLRRAARDTSQPRRPRVAEALATDAIAIGNRLFSSTACTLTINGRALRLDRRECALLHALATNIGQPVTRERLSRAIQRPGGPCSPRAVKSMILRLRRLIEPDAENPRHLRTVRGSGYILLPDAALD